MTGRVWRAVLAAVWIASASIGPARAGVPSAYLVQDSGWMEPFYVDKQSALKPLVGALVAASATSEVVIADFNQDGQIRGRRSPMVLYRGPDDAAKVAAVLEGLQMPVQPGGRLTDADFDGALVHAVQDVLEGKPGILWLVTNNKNSPNNSQLVNQNTRAFAERLSGTQALPMVVAYPVRMAVQGKLYSANGLILYGIAYGDAAADDLKRVLARPAMRGLFADPPVQLKPLDRAALSFVPQRVLTDGVRATLAPDGTLSIEGVSAAGAAVDIEGVLRSGYYPHTIEAATVALRDDAANGLQGEVTPGTISNLPPQGEAPVRVSVIVPATPRPAGLSGLFQKDFALADTLTLALSDMKLSLSDAFVEKTSQVAAMDQLPGVFFDYRTVTAASAPLAVRVLVHFSAWPLVVALLLLALLVIAVLGALLLLRRDREYAVNLGGQTRRVRLKPFERRQVTLPDGRSFAVHGKLFGAPAVTAAVTAGSTPPRSPPRPPPGPPPRPTPLPSRGRR